MVFDKPKSPADTDIIINKYVENTALYFISIEAEKQPNKFL